MEAIRGKAFRQETVRLDDKLFLDCEFEACVLTYAGGRCEWENTRFSNCQVILEGAANHTIQILRGLGFRVQEPTPDRKPIQVISFMN